MKHNSETPCQCHDCTQARWKTSLQGQIETALGSTCIQPANTTTVAPCDSEKKSEAERVKLSGVQDPEGSAQVVGGLLDAAKKSLAMKHKDEARCADCDEAAKHAYSDATTPGFFSDKCSKHRAVASSPDRASMTATENNHMRPVTAEAMVMVHRMFEKPDPASPDRAEELAREIHGKCHYFHVDHDGSIPHTESPNCFDWKPLPTELSTKIAQVIEAHETSYAQKTSALWRWACTCGRMETVDTRDACVSATRLHWGHEVAALLRSRMAEREWTLTDIMKWWTDTHQRWPLSEVELAEKLLKFHRFALSRPLTSAPDTEEKA